MRARVKNVSEVDLGKEFFCPKSGEFTSKLSSILPASLLDP